MLDNALELHRRRVSSIMLPCKKVANISVDQKLSTVKKRFLNSNYSFFVVYQGSVDQVLGIVYLNHILLSDKSLSLRDHLIEIPDISYNASLSEALEVFREKSVPLGKVVGSSGHLLGLVFSRRIIQEIVGDLQIW
jgi:CBS domain containing-hemolysin-like protein